jgi:flagellar biosynthesis protein FlhF
MGEEAMIVGTRTLRRGGVLGVGGREVVEVYVAENATRAGADNGPAGGGGESAATRAQRLQAALERARHAPRFEPANAAASGKEETTRNPAFLEERWGAPVAASTAESLEHPFLKEARRLLGDYDVDATLADRILWELRSVPLPLGLVDESRTRALVRAQVRKLFPPNVPTALRARRGAVQILVGATGVGKTTTVAKLAARAKINERRNVGLITLDTFRIAAVDQLQKYARIIGLPLDVVSDPVEFRAAVAAQRKRGLDLILVDTAGRGQRDELKMRELREFLAVVDDAEVHLVLSTTTQPRTLRSIAERFVPLGVHRVILTKLDEAESFGALVKELAAIGKPVSYVTDGQNVPDDIMVSDPDRLADLVCRVSPGFSS